MQFCFSAAISHKEEEEIVQVAMIGIADITFPFLSLGVSLAGVFVVAFWPTENFTRYCARNFLLALAH